MMIDLYHAEPVANSVKVLICCFEKGIDFNSHYVNLLAFEQHGAPYTAINPDGIVPTLVHDGVVITESSIINEYLDECFADPPLKPESAAARAHMRIWIKWIDDYFGPHASRLGWHFLLHPLAKKLGAEAMAERIAKIPLADRREKWRTVAGESFTQTQMDESRGYIAEGARRLESLLRKGQWTAGDAYSLSDIATFCVAPALPRLAPDLVNRQSTPRILEWLSAMNERPAVQKALAMPNKVRETLAAAGL